MRSLQQIADAIAAAVRPVAPGGKLAQVDVALVNTLAEAFHRREGAGLKVSQAGVDLIKAFEGCRLEAYPDPGSGGDPWTIGYGATGAGIVKGLRWTQAQADDRLDADLTWFAYGVSDALEGAATSQNEFDAMVSLAFNVGLKNFRRSTLLRMHRSGDKAGAAEQFARWNKAAGRVLPGLVRRRAAEAALYRGQS